MNKRKNTTARSSLRTKALGCMNNVLNPRYVHMPKKTTTGPHKMKERKYRFGLGGAAARAELDWLTPEVKRPEKLWVPCS
jgi:hypothetical protein